MSYHRLPQCTPPAELTGFRCSILTTTNTYRGWTISYDPPPIPIRSFDWTGTSPDFDASYEGEEDGWVSNGQQVSAGSRDALIAEIDNWFEDNAS